MLLIAQVAIEFLEVLIAQVVIDGRLISQVVCLFLSTFGHGYVEDFGVSMGLSLYFIFNLINSHCQFKHFLVLFVYSRSVVMLLNHQLKSYRCSQLILTKFVSISSNLRASIWCNGLCTCI